MIDQILQQLTSLGIGTWLINASETQSSELFMIKKREDMLRNAHYSEIAVTVYRDFESAGERKRGSSRVKFSPGATGEEIAQKLAQAYENALSAGNPFYDLPEATVEHRAPAVRKPLIETLRDMQAALYEKDVSGESFINSAELFVQLNRCRTLSSEGTDVSYELFRVNGEFVTQCKQPQDVEMYFSFQYAKPDAKALGELAEKALRLVRDRAQANRAPESGSYDVVLTDEHAAELLGAYLAKCDAAMIYPGYSPCKPGTQLHSPEADGERLSIDVFSSAPFSEEGIPLPERSLIRKGEVVGIHGAARFCRYLGLAPVGSYEGIRVNNGSIPFEEMKKGRVLLPVTFSDFSVDPFRGSFGGEIRLAYLFEDRKVSLLTGGSINGSLSKKQDDLTFSLERYENARYSGPKAVLLRDVSVAGH